MLELNKIYCTDALEGLKQLDDNSIDCVMTCGYSWETKSKLIYVSCPSCLQKNEVKNET